MARSITLAFGAALLMTATGLQPAAAQARKDAAPVPARPAVAPAAPAAPAAAAPRPVVAPVSTTEVSGFRSAKFGMDENEVRAAIVRDLGVKSDAIRAETNPSEQTRVLLVKAPDVLPGGGIAEVSYVFGYKSKTLIQVGATWSKATDEKMTPDQLFSNSTVLRAHFTAAGYKPETIASNMPINGGILMFRGSDAKDHTTMLILQGPIAKGENDQNVLTPTGLVLFYVADAKTPDVYRLTPGSF
jgi:hypothetical protein